MTLAFTVYGVPAPQGSLVPVRSASTGRMFVKQSCKRTMPWRQDVASAAVRAVAASEWAWPTDQPVELYARFFLPRPRGHFGKRGILGSAPALPDRKPDLSKLVRAIEDALTGIVYRDDALIVRESAAKLYVDDNRPPRVEVSIEVLEVLAGLST